MQAAFQIAFEGVNQSDSIEALIREEVKTLEHMDEHITAGRVVVAKQRQQHYTGDPYRIRIHLKVPGGADINVNHDPGIGKSHDAMKVAIHDAFLAAHRRLEDLIRKQEGHTGATGIRPEKPGRKDSAAPEGSI